MNIEVTRDNVTILEQSETPHENEYKITTCYFTFDEFTSSFQVKRAIFTILSTEEMYETDIINNQCDIPSEVLEHEYETVKLGVYGYNIGDNDELLNRFSPSYAEIVVPTGSYKEGALSPEPITPSQYDLYSQALQEGLQEVDDKLDEVVETVDGKLEEVDDKLEEVDTTVNNKMTEVDNKLDEVDGKIDEVDDKIEEVNTAITETNNLNLDVSDKIDGDVTVTLTKKDASTKSVVISDGTSLQFRWQGTSLGVKTDDMEDYIYVDLQGIQGVPGPQGEPFRIKKTYSSVAEMNADFDNMEYGDYVMIASTVEVEDNAKLYTRGESQWIFITDFSGATGIKGETGATPNIQIGTVTSGSVPSVTRTGTNENPVLNFVLQPGEKGNKGDTGATGNGIASITKTSTSGLVDTYTITYTSGNTTTFNVTNGNGIDHISLTSQSGATKVYTIYFTDGNTTTYTVEDGEVTQEVFDEEIERANMIYNAMPKVSGEGTDLTLDNTAECPVYDIELSPSELEQETTTGKNLCFGADYESSNTARFRINKSKLQQNFVLSYISDVTAPNGAIYLFTDGTNRGPLGVSIEQIANTRTSVNISIGTTTWDYIQSATNVWFTSYVGNAGHTSGTIVKEAQIENGSSMTSYEEYTGGQPSPNPDYPQQIYTVSGENSVKVGNKNLLDTSYLVEANADKSLASSGFWAFKLSEELTTFTLSRENNTMYSDGSYLAIGQGADLATANSNKAWLMHPNLQYLNVQSKTLTNTGELWLFTGNSSTNISNMLTKAGYLQLEKNSQATTYVPHQEQTYPISLGNLEYCKIGNYEDEFYKATESDTGLTAGKWYLKKNIGKDIYDGSIDEGWIYNNEFQFFQTINSNINTNALGYTNYYKQYNSVVGIDYGFVLYTYLNTKYFRIKNKDFTTVEQLKTWLSTHNTELYYVLSTPTYTLLSDTLQTQLDNIQKAITYQDQTNVSQTNNDLPFVIKLSAIRDLSGIFELIQE